MRVNPTSSPILPLSDVCNASASARLIIPPSVFAALKTWERTLNRRFTVAGEYPQPAISKLRSIGGGDCGHHTRAELRGFQGGYDGFFLVLPFLRCREILLIGIQPIGNRGALGFRPGNERTLIHCPFDITRPLFCIGLGFESFGLVGPSLSPFPETGLKIHSSGPI